MEYQIRKIKKFIVVVLICINLIFSCNFVFAANTVEVEPTEDQFLELRAVSVTQVSGQNKQVIMELWGNNVEFKGFDVRFAYDSTKLQPSNMNTNEITDDASLFFDFVDEFKNCLSMFTLPVSGEESGVRAIVSFSPPVEEAEHIIEKEGIGKVVNTDGGVLLGKMSFQMTAELFDVSFFHLIEDSTSSPLTGIKINIDGTSYFSNQSTFRFTDRTTSKDASLSDLILSSGVEDEANPENSTYKEYTLTPVFDKETYGYELELLEYIDVMNLKAIQNDLKATMKLKIPKRDENRRSGV